MGGASTGRVRRRCAPRPQAVLVTAAALVFAPVTPALAGKSRADEAATRQVSVATPGATPDGDSRTPAISDDGRRVAFVSEASNLVPGDTNGVADVFVRDLRSGRTTRVSVDSAGRQAAGSSDLPALSYDGRYVAFESWAPNLVPGDTNGFLDVFIHDVKSGITRRVSVAAGGRQADQGGGRPLLSESGRFVAFTSTATNLVPGAQHFYQDAYLRDLVTGTVRRISTARNGSLADGMSTAFGISDDGRRVVFESSAPDIVAGDTNDQFDVFVHDDRTRRSTRVSVGPKGRQADSYSLGGRISGDGRYAAFGSAATNLVAGDTNGQTDVFLHDLLGGRTYRASLAGYGAQLDGASLLHDISDDGKEVAFESFAPNAVPGDTNGAYDVFVRDADDGSTTRVSLAADGAEPDAPSGRPVISGDGRHVAFESGATNLVTGTDGAGRDVFVRSLH
jgi:Tol biopolymer transport system component